MASELLSKDHAQLLDVIDQLRSLGISRYVSLPQIIVCGDQSSGKSSVLEAVSGVRFPTKDNLCTRFATELVLRNLSTTNATVEIAPGAERSDEQKARLSQFKAPTIDLSELPALIDAAKEAMGLGLDSRAFSDDILRIEISGPQQPNLTLVDLPGLIHSENKLQSTKDVQLVSDLVRSYMANTRSIILAVVSAKNDYANQIVTKLARDVDPKGYRTLGIITKPDTLHVGSSSEEAFVSLAKNEDVVFRLGWHVLKNRDFGNMACSVEQRDQDEREFFLKGIWTNLSPKFLGVGTLKPRLSTVLKDQVTAELPNLINDVDTSIHECKHRLLQLGDARGTLREQKEYLVHISQSYSSFVKSAIGGIYRDDFFGDPLSDRGYEKRLRAVLQNLFQEFSKDMLQEGHSQRIVDDDSSESHAAKPNDILRSQYIENVRELMKRTRGCELPGTFNPLIIGDLFYQQSKPWEGIVNRYSEKVLSATRTCVELILDHITDIDTSERLLRELIDPAMETYRKTLKAKMAEIMHPHQKGHPITYNHYFIETIQKARQAHAEKEQARRLNLFFKLKPGTTSKHVVHSDFSIGELLNALNVRTEAEMDRYACTEAVYCMEAYYKVAMKIIVDNFAVLAVELCLLNRLPEAFSPDTVMSLNETLIKYIATEAEESSLERSFMSAKLRTLEQALQKLTRLGRQKPAIRSLEAADYVPANVQRDIIDETDQEDGMSVSEVEPYPDERNTGSLVSRRSTSPEISTLESREEATPETPPEDLPEAPPAKEPVPLFPFRGNESLNADNFWINGQAEAPKKKTSKKVS